jgi:hypothetical protein
MVEPWTGDRRCWRGTYGVTEVRILGTVTMPCWWVDDLEGDVGSRLAVQLRSERDRKHANNMSRKNRLLLGYMLLRKIQILTTADIFGCPCCRSNPHFLPLDYCTILLISLLHPCLLKVTVTIQSCTPLSKPIKAFHLRNIKSYWSLCGPTGSCPLSLSLTQLQPLWPSWDPLTFSAQALPSCPPVLFGLCSAVPSRCIHPGRLSVPALFSSQP